VRICALTAAVACVVAALIDVASVQAVTKHVFYGRPGKVQLLKMQGFREPPQNPQVIFPTHSIRRSPLAPGTRQKICTTLQIWSQVGTPPSAWAVKASSRNFCGWIVPGNYASVGKWSWEGAAGTPYHAKFVVTWATRTRKLAKASYDFNGVDDYHCLSRFCLIDTDQTTNVPYIAFY
jgi:hypothetical protein